MKKNLFTSYMYGVKDHAHGEGFSQIFKYFAPEFITALILYSVPILVDARWIAHLQSTSAYATLGVTNTLLHLVIKMAEAVSVATIVMVGQANGIQEFKKAGQSLINSFWTTVLSGGIISALLFFGAPFIYRWYCVPEDMIVLGTPFMKVRAIGVFFMFIYFACIGFLRGIKNTQVPMYIFMAGCSVFLLVDYLLIFGVCGFPELKLMGSAYASVIQYIFMTVLACYYVFYHPSVKKYGISLFENLLNIEYMGELLRLSTPVVIDKATMAMAYIWLGWCISPLGTVGLASFSVIKDLERFAFLPAIAFAQVITFLVSNKYAQHDWEGIKSTIKKIIFMSSFMVFVVLLICSMYPEQIIRFFDFKGEFSLFAAKAFPVVSVLVFLDLLQLILAGALRGAANVSTVMWIRLGVVLLFFAPLAYIVGHKLPIADPVVRFVCVYGLFYLGNGVMSLLYIRRFRGEQWKHKVTKGTA